MLVELLDYLFHLALQALLGHPVETEPVFGLLGLLLLFLAFFAFFLFRFFFFLFHFLSQVLIKDRRGFHHEIKAKLFLEGEFVYFFGETSAYSFADGLYYPFVLVLLVVVDGQQVLLDRLYLGHFLNKGGQITGMDHRNAVVSLAEDLEGRGLLEPGLAEQFIEYALS